MATNSKDLSRAIITLSASILMMIMRNYECTFGATTNAHSAFMTQIPWEDNFFIGQYILSITFFFFVDTDFQSLPRKSLSIIAEDGYEIVTSTREGNIINVTENDREIL